MIYKKNYNNNEIHTVQSYSPINTSIFVLSF